jgi:hypothetical protein
MTGMSAVDREIFSLLSEGTAKQKLLAEQVNSHKYSAVPYFLTLTTAARLNDWSFRANMPLHNACGMHERSRAPNALREGPFCSHYPPSHRPDTGDVLLSQHMFFRAARMYHLTSTGLVSHIRHSLSTKCHPQSTPFQLSLALLGPSPSLLA